MEYYYCPSLLKLLRYLWVSAAVRTRISFFFSSRLLPALLPGSVWSAVALFSLRNGGCFKEEGVLGKGWGLIWEAEGTHRRGRGPAQGGSMGTAATPPVLGKTGKTRGALVIFPEIDVSLIYRTVLYSEITSYLPLCARKNVSSFMSWKE